MLGRGGGLSSLLINFGSFFRTTKSYCQGMMMRCSEEAE